MYYLCIILFIFFICDFVVHFIHDIVHFLRRDININTGNMHLVIKSDLYDEAA